MRRYSIPVSALVVAALAIVQPVAAQEKEEKEERIEKVEKIEKKEKIEKEEKKVKPINNEEIVIKRKTDKDEKVVIEIKDGEVTVNGKPIEDYDGDNVVVRKRKSLSITTSPFRGQSGALSFNGDGDVFGYGNTNSKIAFLGVVTEKDDKGAKIEEVTEGSAADKAGLKEGDVIMRIDEELIEEPDDLTKVIRKHKPEDKVVISYSRDGKSKKTDVKLGGRSSSTTVYATPRLKTAPYPAPNFKWDMDGQGFMYNSRPRLGIKAQDTDEGKGVKVIGVDEESIADKAGIKEDDIITEFDEKKVNSTDELSKFAREAQVAQKNAVKVTFSRNGKSQTVELKTPKKLKTANL